MFMPGTSELLIIFGALLLLFGANKLPKLGGALGESIRNFKKGLKTDDDDQDKKNIDPPGRDKNDKQP